MSSLVDNESHWANVYMKQDKDVFIKLMSVVEELGYLTTSSSLSSTQIGENIHEKEVKV